ncbi:MAG: hypothetical protein U0836_02645 [Pirellulales bacterium]
MIRRNLRVYLCLAVFGGLLAADLPAAVAQDQGSEEGGQGEGRGRGARGGGQGRNRGPDGQNGEGGGRNGRGGGGGRGQRREERPAEAPKPSPAVPAASNPTSPPPSNRGFNSGNSGGRTSGFGSNSPASLPPSGAAAAGAAANADAMLKRFDTLKPDGVLDADELARSRFINMRPADRNGDGKVTKEELTAWYVARAQGGGAAAPASTAAAPNVAVAAKPAPAATAAPPSDASATAPASGGSSSTEPQRKSYRFLSAMERLPGGLPSWFRDKDRDRDGQVLMSEWTTQWTDSAVNEFSKHDRNGDGVITPSEALRSGG